MTQTSKEAVKEFLALAEKRLKECGHRNRVASYYGGNRTNECTGCPAKGEYGGAYESCIYDAALDVGGK